DAATPRVVKLVTSPDALAELTRRMSALTEPAAVASDLASRAADWLPLAFWSVVAVDHDGPLHWFADPSADPALQAPAEAIANRVIETSKPYTTDRVAADREVGMPIEASAIAWPLRARGDAESVIGVLVGLDQGRARRVPRLAPALVSALTQLVEPAGVA